ncbi:hypothetical protein KP509_33G060800 [Ceratopteris richardii]|nr:hypothetical protein KP509_33G060800 [Ceratopteris richardii]
MSITIEAPKSSSSTAFSLRPKCACISLPCESDSHSTTPTAAAARRPSSASSSSTTVPMPPLATRLKTLFKSKKSSSELQFQRRESVSQSSCRLSISTKTFWPFSRSHSVGESKTAVRPAVHYRSNSAGQIHSFMDSSMKKADLFDFTMSSSSTATHQFNRQEPAIQICERKFDNGEERILAKGNNGDNTRLDLLRATNDSGTNSSGIGSPVRREALSANCGSKAHAGIARSNLELHSAKRRLSSSRGWRGLDRRGSFPVGTRVSPVLNVAVYGGSSLPKISIFGLNYLPLLRKVKPVVDTLGCRYRS